MNSPTECSCKWAAELIKPGRTTKLPNIPNRFLDLYLKDTVPIVVTARPAYGLNQQMWLM